MEDVAQKFRTISLPYTYVNVPTPSESENRPKNNIKYFINKVITNLTRATFKHAGFKVTEDPRHWNASWGRQYTEEEYKKCEAWQKINHFACAFLVGRKDHLHSRMCELKERVGDFASFYPTSYLLPQDAKQLNAEWKKYPYWIVKPSASSRGRGIHILTNEDEVPQKDGIVQKYIYKPLLILKRKFDIRLYVLITNIEPLRIYIHKSGMARFCTHEYDPNGTTDDLQMHLTNFSVNKEDDHFVRCNDKNESVNNSKWSLDFFLKYMDKNGHDSNMLMKEFERISIATVIAGMCKIKEKHLQLIPHRHTSYEMYGIDIMLDEDMKGYLVEINISPSLSGLDSELDQKLKYPLNLDLLRMARIIDCNPNVDNPCPGVEKIDEKFYESMSKERVEAVLNGADPWKNPVFADFVIIRDYIEEYQIKSDFRLIYPIPETMDTYEKCFDKLSYRDIVFQKWIKMSKKDKFNVLNKNWKVYSDVMASIKSSLPK